jgi:hypothetical protein
MSNRNFYTTDATTTNPLGGGDDGHTTRLTWNPDAGGYLRQRDSKDDEGWICCGIGLYVLLRIWSLVSVLGGFIWGVVVLVEDYGDIPACASCYKGWSIAMTILFGLGSVNSKTNSDSDSDGGQLTSGMVAGVAGFVALLTGLVSGLGYHKVWTHPPQSCDLSPIHGISVWTDAIIWYYGVLTVLSLLVMVTAILYGCCHSRRRQPSLGGLDEA